MPDAETRNMYNHDEEGSSHAYQSDRSVSIHDATTWYAKNMLNADIAIMYLLDGEDFSRLFQSNWSMIALKEKEKKPISARHL